MDTVKTLPQHAASSYFNVVDDVLQIGGMPLIQLALRVGQTPFYAYDRQAMSERVAELRAALPTAIKLHYAMKANPMPAVVQYLTPMVDGLDVASGGELKVALDAGANPRDISFAGPGKSRQELLCALASGITINLESPFELETLAQLAREYALKPRVAVRVNPDFELKSSGMKMGGGPKQFGVDAESVPALLQRIGELQFDFQGFHIFSGSQNLKADSISEAQDKTLALAQRLSSAAPGPVKVLNLGGGFGIPYFPGETPLDLTAIGEHLAAVLPAAQAALPHTEFVIELGRFLVGEAGVYVCQVLERKISRGQVFLVTNGGLHHHLAASGNFGQVIRKNYPVAVGNKMRGGPRESASVVGPLCTPLDLLADKMDLAQAEVGDLIVVFQSGAYGLSASPAGFLSHPHAVEVLV